jgi:hypothetical protein
MSFRGAAQVAADGHSLVMWGQDGRAERLNGEFVRDEAEQATYLREVLDVFQSEGVDAACVYTFARYDLPHRADRRVDLDLASRGVVKVLDRQSPSRPTRRRLAARTVSPLLSDQPGRAVQRALNESCRSWVTLIFQRKGFNSLGRNRPSDRVKPCLAH